MVKRIPGRDDLHLLNGGIFNACIVAGTSVRPNGDSQSAYRPLYNYVRFEQVTMQVETAKFLPRSELDPGFRTIG